MASTLWLQRRGTAPDRLRPFVYRFAAGRLISDRAVPGLDALRVEEPPPEPPPEPIPQNQWQGQEAGEPRFLDDVWVGERPWTLSCYRQGEHQTRDGRPGDLDDPNVDLLSFDGGSIAMPTDGKLVEWDLNPTLSPGQRAAWIHGPALCSALAHQGIFCLHGSAVLAPWGVVAFLGESGAGKSTLAGLLADLDWPRVADDVFPILSSARPYAREPTDNLQRSDQEIRVSPEMAHLGLPIPQRQAIASLPSTLPLTQICVLKPQDTSEKVHGRALSPSESMAKLLGQTIAVNLFESPLARRLLDRWAQVVHRVGVIELGYPRSKTIGPEVQAFLARQKRTKPIYRQIAVTAEPSAEP